MNYIELINQFWRHNEEHSFTPSEVAVYFYLLNTANRLMWKNPFGQSNGYITNALGISEPTLIRARNSLKQFGLIDFRSEKGRRHQVQYILKYLNNLSISVSNYVVGDNKTLNNLSIYDSNTVSNSDSISVSICDENSLDNYKHKLNKTKQNDEGGSAADIAGSSEEDQVRRFLATKEANAPPPSPAPPPSVTQLFMPVEDLRERCIQDAAFYEPLCMRLHLSIESLSGWLEAFNRELLFKSESRKLPKDYRKHFADWIKFRDVTTDPAEYSPVKKQENGSGKKNIQNQQPTGVVVSGAKTYGKL
ncbi:hypothetical protein [Chitinophaga sp. CF418]|uniref:DUF7833 domain-containing protein n=1 Tax=Chitinophaga sp. CF418 TaxID=1855287 RepID=UPI000914A17F|nr:hypothetical protein [Chitinophaga sp. CF418]SHN45883.1 hypothetical protein SAMN05216311_12212 [Chitinophaga sp. CF418]